MIRITTTNQIKNFNYRFLNFILQNTIKINGKYITGCTLNQLKNKFENTLSCSDKVINKCHELEKDGLILQIRINEWVKI